jgi:predicted RNA binding protein YcfA (HicA-like mRNA interferase family)
VAKPPVLKPREVIALLERLGFREVRQRGSHKQFRHADGRVTTVPVHGGRDISPILLRHIAHDLHVTLDELLGAKR